ncbi:Hsp20 family protein [Candidatus Dojkabacteria bacterium]|nr:Hsp20 family protein [Candidatus Dojkabacteria bacterium]
MNKLSIWNPRRFLSQFSEFPGQDWGWLDYPGNELDMYEEDDSLVIELKVPGFKQDEIDIKIASGAAIITGNKKEEKQKTRNYYRREIQTSSFTRRVDLPFAIEAQNADAELSDGVLKLILPKSEEAKPESIKISVK